MLENADFIVSLFLFISFHFIPFLLFFHSAFVCMFSFCISSSHTFIMNMMANLLNSKNLSHVTRTNIIQNHTQLKIQHIKWYNQNFCSVHGHAHLRISIENLSERCVCGENCKRRGKNVNRLRHRQFICPKAKTTKKKKTEYNKNKCEIEYEE